ncbi:hypothetical protein [Rhizobium sp. P40RR-XXII]|uniref:hypothetical protein n=1 Tax=Rhizobium sp. P40RR-XXII TaxID=2726739 RepID=UPI003917CA85
MVAFKDMAAEIDEPNDARGASVARRASRRQSNALLRRPVQTTPLFRSTLLIKPFSSDKNQPWARLFSRLLHPCDQIQAPSAASESPWETTDIRWYWKVFLRLFEDPLRRRNRPMSHGLPPQQEEPTMPFPCPRAQDLEQRIEELKVAAKDALEEVIASANQAGWGTREVLVALVEAVRSLDKANSADPDPADDPPIGNAVREQIGHGEQFD